MSHVPTTLPTIERLISRIASADRSNQREIRLTIQEGRDLAIELSLLTTKMASTLLNIETSLANIKTDSVVKVDVSGGKF